MSIQNQLINEIRWTQPLAPKSIQNNYLTPQTFKHYGTAANHAESINHMKRVLVIGSSGSGKSTLARQLGATLELPVIHLDRHYWHAGWVGTPKDEWQKTVKKLVQRDAWIMDGNYRGTLNIRLQAADSVVFLDLPPWMCALRAIKRRIQYRNRPRPDIAEGCKEPLFDPQLFNFVRHVLNYPDRAKPYVMQQLKSIVPSKRVILLKTTQDVNNFINAPLDFPALNSVYEAQATPSPEMVRLPME